MTFTEAKPLVYTGERMVPESCDPDTFWEHIFRYQFATKFVFGKNVLDVACGEGYGSAALLAAGARSVIGVDIDPVSCMHAHTKYGINVRVGSAEQLPLADRSVDVVVSFETIEHVPNPLVMLSECRRVLRPGGRIVISTPNKGVYGGDWKNPYHVNEMTLDEFTTAIRKEFTLLRVYAQRPTRYSPRIPSTYILSSGRRARAIGLLTKYGARFLNPNYVPEPTAELRNRIPELICRRARPGSHLINRYVVRKADLRAEERPVYYVAVAQVGAK
jgi:2-polyprenyl-3-methyl-5-hydroxy-6-metoxy-1,4-benzoquinol methylase